MSQIILRAGSKRLRLFSHAVGLPINHATNSSMIPKKPSRSNWSSSGFTDSVVVETAAAAAAAPPLPRQQIFTSVRFFAAPTSAKNLERNAEKETRINEEIRAPYVRLVTDEGHEIITMVEALRRAKTLDLDLVEVASKAEPPVCKIMDFKEKYQKQIRDKALVKSKADTTLKSECKEVRFSKKIEQRDLKMKAETVKRLMEQGYKVKITAQGGRKSDMLDAEREVLGILLDRLYNLIEDDSAVEGSRIFEKGNAYMIVRHAKIGNKKNPAKKTSKTDKSGNGIEMQIDSTSTGEGHDADMIVEPSRPSSHVLENLANSSSKESGSLKFNNLKSPVASEANPRLDSRENQIRRTVSNDPSTVKLEPSTAPSNRYKSSNAHTRLNGGGFPVRPPSDRNQHRGQLDLKQCQPPDHPNTKGNSPLQYSPKERKTHGEFDFRQRDQRQPFRGHVNSTSRITPEKIQKYPQSDFRNQQSVPCGPSAVPSNFGKFSVSKAADIGERKRLSNMNNDNRENTLNLPKSEGEALRQEDKIDRRWGIFSR